MAADETGTPTYQDAAGRLHLKVDYDTDFYGWTQAQAAALRAHESKTLDWDHLAEEIESLGQRDRDAIESQLVRLLLLLLKLTYDPATMACSTRRPHEPAVCDRDGDLSAARRPVHRGLVGGRLVALAPASAGPLVAGERRVIRMVLAWVVVTVVKLTVVVCVAAAGSPVRCTTYEEKTLGRLQTLCDDGTRAVSTWSPTLQR
jgi:hypothetical protein